MLLQAYENIKTRIEAETALIKHIDWFNDQYSGTIHTVPAVFVEFPTQLQFRTLRGQFQQSPFTVRIHLVTKALADQAKRIDPTLIQNHEELTQIIYYALQGYWAMLSPQQKLFDSLGRTAYQHHQYMRGWLVTTQDFESRIYQHQQIKPTHKIDDMAVNANIE